MVQQAPVPVAMSFPSFKTIEAQAAAAESVVASHVAAFSSWTADKIKAAIAAGETLPHGLDVMRQEITDFLPRAEAIGQDLILIAQLLDQYAAIKAAPITG